MLDAELAAELWVLVEGRVPVVIATAADPEDALALRDALVELAPTGLQRVTIAGAAETFDWLPQAGELGWRTSTDDQASATAVASAPAGASDAADRIIDAPVRPDTSILVLPAVPAMPSHAWGEVVRLAVRAATIGYGLAAVVPGDSLEDVFALLRRPPIGLVDDERSRLGVVLVIRAAGPDGPPRVVAAHYVRPTARDEHGHVQRLGPGVLATWDAETDRFEHFGWGITPELARRVGRRAGDLEADIDRRRDALAAILADPALTDDAAHAAIDRLRQPLEPAIASD